MIISNLKTKNITNFIKKMKSIAKTTFTSPINRDGGSSGIITPLIDKTESIIELFEIIEGYEYTVEWDIPELEETEYIGIWCRDGKKTLSDYDGVFEIPLEIQKFLEDNGFDCSYLEE
jgi:hypothetical protein